MIVALCTNISTAFGENEVKTTPDGQFQYYIHGDDIDGGEAVFIKYLGTSTEMVIPACIDEEGNYSDDLFDDHNVCTTEAFWKSATSVEKVVYKLCDNHHGSEESRALDSAYLMSYAPKLKDVGYQDYNNNYYHFTSIFDHCLYNIHNDDLGDYYEYLQAVPGGLEEITLKGGCGEVKSFLEVSSSLKRINVNNQNSTSSNHDGFWSLNGLLMKGDTLVAVPGAYTRSKILELPEGIKQAHNNAFPNYNEVVFPDGMECFKAYGTYSSNSSYGTVKPPNYVVLNYPSIVRFPKTLKKLYGEDNKYSGFSSVRPEIKKLYFDMSEKNAKANINCLECTGETDDNTMTIKEFCNKYFPNATIYYNKTEEQTTPSETVKPTESPKPSETIKPSESPNQVVAYSDVPTSGKWYSEAVYYATAKGYMAGTGNNKFSPDATVTRGTIAQILYAAEGKPAVSGKSQFADVGETKWYAKAVKWAADKGLVSGYGNGKFGPEDRITREQMVAIMMQYSKMKGYDTTAIADLSKFRDQNKISKWAVNAVKWGVSHKIVSGTDKGIEPKGNATRAQIAVILQAYDKNLRKKE